MLFRRDPGIGESDKPDRPEAHLALFAGDPISVDPRLRAGRTNPQPQAGAVAVIARLFDSVDVGHSQLFGLPCHRTSHTFTYAPAGMMANVGDTVKCHEQAIS